MKKFLFLVLFLGLCNFAFADVTAKIIAVDKDEQGSIRVKTQYFLDGIQVQSNYPPIDGKYYWVTRYSMENFAGMTKPQILARVKKDIQAFEKHLITKKFLQINNDIFVTGSQDIVNTTDTQATASMYVDKNQDGILDTEWQVKSNGEKTEIPYTPVTP